MKNINVILRKIKNKLVKEYPLYVSDIYLFDSRAYGKPYKTSDYDILVVLKNSINWKQKDEINSIFFSFAFEYDFLPDIKYVTSECIDQRINLDIFVIDALNNGIRI